MAEQIEAEQTQPILAPIPRRMVYALMALFASQIALTFVAMMFAYTANARSDQQWCGLLRPLRAAPSASQPPSQASRDFRAQIQHLYDEFDCASKEE